MSTAHTILRQWNPTRAQWYGTAVATGVVVGVAIYALMRDDTPAPVPGGVPGGEGAGGPFGPFPLPLPGDEGLGGEFDPGEDPFEPDDQFDPPDDQFEDPNDPGIPPQDPGELDPGLPGGAGPFDDDYQPPQGGIDLPPGGQGPFDLGPVVGPITPGIFTPPEPPPAELIYQPATEHLNLAPTPWTKRYTQHIVLFDFAQGKHQLLRDWAIRFGICLTTNASFGELTKFLSGQGAGGGEFDTEGDAFADPMARFGLRNVDGASIDGTGFITPLTYKDIFSAKFRRGNPVQITQGLKSGVDWPAVTACQAPQRWPTPSSASGFFVRRVGGGAMEQWDPKPQVSLLVQGTKIIMRISYIGMPFFEMTPGESNAGNPKTAFKLDLKVYAVGTNP